MPTHRGRRRQRRRRGYCGCRPSCTGGQPTIRIVGSSTSSISLLTRRSCVLHGAGCGATGAHVRRASMARRLLRDRSRARRGGVSRRAAGRSSGPHVPPGSGAGADDPETRRQAPPAGHPDRPGPAGPGCAQAGARPGRRDAHASPKRALHRPRIARDGPYPTSAPEGSRTGRPTSINQTPSPTSRRSSCPSLRASPGHPSVESAR